ncbi:alcohol dehydrogenase [Plantibacter sp. Leaf171]|uniref:aldo/keto reductase n=1 Tax=unclassified Plantibacter TaxID=2624265 RepID=UPI0006FA88BC|nr:MULTISPECIES: aldo/keto reductase [unclassified Plantibacter]KQM13501.1 alcohol dehydrogenase [Plantibacter sp. Leaf1]KQQ53079.1 alcohol dehydrogenase [Plantibacter sp. Leaf314]KQR56609.1 alcohol dehydrogenase [Plantibacter sp. Leaf171]
MTHARTTLGTSDLSVFPLNLGGNVFGWTADRQTSFDILDAFVAGGGNFIDTADGYSAWVPGNTGGDSERLIGEWQELRGNRDELVIATKVSQHPDFQGLAADNILKAADASLERLRTDHIDLYYAHFDDESVPLEETVTALSSLVDAGKVRYLGISNYSAARIAEWFEIVEAKGLHRPIALQPHYNLVEREFEGELRTIAEREQLAVLPYFSLAKGFLTGKYREGASVDSVRAEGAQAYLADHAALLPVLDEVASAHGVSVATVSLAWLRSQPTVAAPIASARTVEQLPDLLASATLELSADELAALTAASVA